jgi:lipopolysaccharide transport system ATP-binding protein
VIPPALVLQNVGKSYVKYRSELHRFARWFGFSATPLAEQWAVRDVSFRVNRGQSLGIIGQNGAGKSTILKLVTGTTRPTEGRIEVHGKVSALLELGLGMNPELTGRENAIHSAGLMGISQSLIRELLPAIETFAEIGKYFDQPMRTYSSGMQMRVAFSVATAVRPEILIVDEALAVGDTYFVHKCFQRIREFRQTGTTLLIVSHDPTAIQTLCDRVILLDRGRMVLDGDPQEVFDYYNALIADKENQTVRTTRSIHGQVATESGSGEAVIEHLELVDADNQPMEVVAVGQLLTLRARVRVKSVIERLVYGYMIRDRLGQPVFGTNTHYTDQACPDLSPGDEIEFAAQFSVNLGPGSYSVSVALTSTETHLVNNYQWRDLALVFSVANIEHAQFVGTAWIPPTIKVSTISRPLIASNYALTEKEQS